MTEFVDRLAELRSFKPIKDEESLNDSIEDGNPDYFLAFEEIRKKIGIIESMLDEVKRVKNAIIETTRDSPDYTAAKREDIELTDKVKQLSKAIVIGLKRLQEEVKRDELGPDRSSAEFRIKKAQFNCLGQGYKKTMLKYNNLLEEHRDITKDRIKRQLLIANEKSSDEAVEEYLERKDVNIFSQDILTEVSQKRLILDELESRKQDILKLNEDVEELHDMFYDMMILVDEQGDLVDNIEHQVEHASVYVKKAAATTVQAVVLHKRNTKLKWIICLVVTSVIVAGVLIVAVIVAITLGIRSK